MRLKDLARIIIICCLFANTIGLIFITEWFQKVFINWQQAIASGVLFFGIECLIFYMLLKPYLPEFSLRKVFSWKRFISAVLMSLAVWLLTQVWMHFKIGANPLYPSSQKVTKYAIIFLLNSFPNALFEEFIFRFLPVHYAEKKGFTNQQLIGLGIIVTFIFSLSHVTSYLFRDHTDLSQLFSALVSVYFFGMVFLFVYLLTGNIYFTTLIHAFDNNKLLLINTVGTEQFYFYTVIFVSLLWFAAREVKKMIS